MTTLSAMTSDLVAHGRSANRTQKRTHRTRRRLLQASLSVFSERGVDIATIEEITERADLGKGTFYRYFENKEAVMLDLVVDAVARLIDGFRGADAPPASLDESLRKIVDAHVHFFLENRDEFVLLFQGRLFLKLQREGSEEFEQPFADYLQAIEDSVKTFIAKPIGREKVRHFAHAMAGFVSGFLSFAMIGMERREIEKSMGSLREAFVSGAMSFLASEDSPPPSTAPKA